MPAKFDNIFEHIGLTYGEILEILATKNQKFKEIIENGRICSVAATNLAGKGYASAVFRVIVDFDNRNEAIADRLENSLRLMIKKNFERINFIIKIPYQGDDVYERMFPSDNKEYSETSSLYDTEECPSHNIECDFYEIFGSKNILPIPEVYFCRKILPNSKNVGVIIMKDFGENSSCFDMFTSLNKKQIISVVEKIACFHANLLSEKISDYFGSYFFNEDDVKIREKLMSKVKAYKPGMFDNHFFKLGKLLETSSFVNYAVSECCNDLGLPSILCHGDLWNNNILWHNYDDGSASNKILAFIDFTEVFIGNPMFDLAKLMIFGVDAEIRREVETTIFEHYFNEFLKSLDIHVANPFDGKLDQLKQAYGYCMVYMALELALWSIYFKEATITYETIQEVHDAKMEKLMLRARLALDDAVQFLEKHDRKWILN